MLICIQVRSENLRQSYYVLPVTRSLTRSSRGNEGRPKRRRRKEDKMRTGRWGGRVHWRSISTQESRSFPRLKKKKKSEVSRVRPFLSFPSHPRPPNPLRTVLRVAGPTVTQSPSPPIILFAIEPSARRQAKNTCCGGMRGQVVGQVAKTAQVGSR